MKQLLFVFLVITFFTFSALAESKKVESIYTDLTVEKCRTIASNEDEGGWYRGECPGVGGYKLELIEGDIRQSINVIAPNGKKTELDFWSNVSSAFSAVGDKAEWRVHRTGKVIKPFALIIRYNTNEDPENTEKLTSRLIVTKIKNDLACITDVVEPVRNANTMARQLADASAQKPCKFETGANSGQTDTGLGLTESYVKTIRNFIESEGKPHLIIADVADYNNGKAPIWKKYASEAEFEKGRENEESYEIAYIWKKDGKVVATNFTYSSPSGDWAQYVYYVFRGDGTVAQADRNLRTFMNDIIVNRSYVYDEAGNLLKETKEFRDLGTEEPTKEPEGFIDIDVDIYKKTSDLPFASMISSDSGGKPATGKPELSFVPSGWSLEGKTEGDLNGDSLPDSVLQIKLNEEEAENDRGLIILFKKPDGYFTKAAEAKNVLICSWCGGAKGSPPDLRIENGTLLISQLSGSRAFTSYLHRFRYESSNRKFLLIGEDISDSDGTGTTVSTSTNYLTGKQIVTKTKYNERTDKDVIVSSQSKQVSKSKKYIEEVGL